MQTSFKNTAQAQHMLYSIFKLKISLSNPSIKRNKLKLNNDKIILPMITRPPISFSKLFFSLDFYHGS